MPLWKKQILTVAPHFFELVLSLLLSNLKECDITSPVTLPHLACVITDLQPEISPHYLVALPAWPVTSSSLIGDITNLSSNITLNGSMP